jgi:hypothetical protein
MVRLQTDGTGLNAAAEFHLLAVDREILLNVHDQGGIGEPDPIAHGGTKHLRVGLPGNFYGHLNISHDFSLKSEHAAQAAVFDQRHGACLAGFETHGRTGRNIQAITSSGLAVKS